MNVLYINRQSSLHLSNQIAVHNHCRQFDALTHVLLVFHSYADHSYLMVHIVTELDYLLQRFLSTLF